MRATSVTWPRLTPRRSASRTSPSHRANSDGSLIEGLKKRWLTDRTSTATRVPPTSPSAAPNPVMLRIIDKRVSYALTTTLSIPELPAHAVELVQSRHQVARHELVRHTLDVPELIGQHRAHDPYFEMEVIKP